MAGLVPAIPLLMGAAFHVAGITCTGITCTRPVMTWERLLKRLSRTKPEMGRAAFRAAL